MSLSLYCSKCGSKNEYTIKKPEFCGSCGTKYAAASSALIPSRKVKANEPETDSEVDISLPNIEKIQIELSIPGATNAKGWVLNEDRQTARRRLAGRVGTDITNVIATNVGHNPEIRRTIDPKVNAAQVLAELKRESVSNRKSEEIN